MRLKVEMDEDGVKIQRFQFQIGAIKSVVGGSIVHMPQRFQFQIGAIKSDGRLCRIAQAERFQFQIGAIKSVLECYFDSGVGGFNSK